MALVTRDHGLEWGGDTQEMRADLQARLGGAPLWLLSGRIRDLDGLRQVRRIRSEVNAFGPDVTHFQQATMVDPRLFVVRHPSRISMRVCHRSGGSNT